jgi:hypothetical protein
MSRHRKPRRWKRRPPSSPRRAAARSGPRPVRALLWLVARWACWRWRPVGVGQRDWLAARAPQSARCCARCAPPGLPDPALPAARRHRHRQLGFNRVAGSEFRFSVSLRNSADWPVASPALELT